MQGILRRSCRIFFAAQLVLGMGYGGLGGEPSWAQAGPGISTETSLHAVHDTLFASFLPVDDLPKDPRTTGLLIAARDGIWQQTGSSPAFQRILQPFEHLHGFGNPCGIAHAI